MPREDSWSHRYHIVEMDPEFYNITNWTDDTVDAVPANPGNGCRVMTMNLNFENEEFYQITRNGSGECEFLGETIDRLEKPRISQIVDGENVISEEFAKVEKAAFEVLASSFRADIHVLIDKYAAKQAVSQK